MTRTCALCRRVNPDEAAFCYHDGSPLTRLDEEEVKSLAAASRPFSIPFIFPSGRSCRNFDELAQACLDSPRAAVEVLVKGYLGSFLATQGRADLAEAAVAVERAGDRELALDDFLGLLPTEILTPARLRVAPQLIDLGILAVGQDRRCEVMLYNDGKRLLTGSVRCEDTLWLSLGEGPTQRGKLFQVSGPTPLTIRVLGKHVRAYHKPQEAPIVIESNGGSAIVVVRIEVPVFRFPEGELTGVTSPREMAEKMLAAPHVAAGLITSGAVARWYAANGWIYPVQGPPAPGIAAVQQFFESLGLAKPPRLSVREKAVQLHGEPGAAVESGVSIVTEENRPVMAHGGSDQAWLQVGPAVAGNRSAFVPLRVPRVPGGPGTVHQARVTIIGNGNQRFVVPVTLTVAGVKEVDSLPEPALPPLPDHMPEPVPPPPPPPLRQTPPAKRMWVRWAMGVAVVALVALLAAAAWWFSR
jgi:hypothetical protein